MKYPFKRYIRAYIALGMVLGVLIVGSEDAISGNAGVSALHLTAGISDISMMDYESINAPDTPSYRIAKRLQKRIRKNRKLAPSLHRLVRAVETRQQLLKRHARVIFSTQEDSEYSTWDVSLQRYPLWLSPRFSFTDANFYLNPDRVEQTMEIDHTIEVIPPKFATLTAVKDPERSSSHAIIEGVAKSGYSLEISDAAEAIVRALSNGEKGVQIPLSYEEGRVINMTDTDLGDLKLLAAGHSNFKGSTYSRVKNVQKALDNHVNNSIVGPGETFSFNNTLEGRVSIANGWHMAKVILNGDQLVSQPGGGICQASTTTYRAIVNAGLPVLDRRSHSLYVYYYKEYGVGIDATVYPGTQDLVFRNDTDHHLVIQAYTEGSDAYVNIYGTPDGRSVELEGPYFAQNQPDGFETNGRPLWKNEIAWLQHVTYPSGDIVNNQIVSRYKYLPKGLAAEFINKTAHAAAGEEQL